MIDVEVIPRSDPRWTEVQRRSAKIDRPRQHWVVLVTAAIYAIWCIGCLVIGSAFLDGGGSVAILIGAGWPVSAGSATLVSARRVGGGDEGDKRIAEVRADRQPWWSANPVTVAGSALVEDERPITGTADRGALFATSDGLLFVPGRVEYPACQLPWSEVREISIADHGRGFAPGFIVATSSGEVVVKTSKGPLLAERWTQPAFDPADDL